MNHVTTTAETFCVPSAAWSGSRSGGASLAGAAVYPLSVPATVAAKHAQKRFTMARTDIDGWPLGPGDGMSG